MGRRVATSDAAGVLTLHPAYRKGAVALASFVVTVVTLAVAQGGLIPDAYAGWALLIVAVGNLYGVVRVPNARQGVAGQRAPLEAAEGP